MNKKTEAAASWAGRPFGQGEVNRRCCWRVVGGSWVKLGILILYRAGMSGQAVTGMVAVVR
jgi:hypothetical protein